MSRVSKFDTYKKKAPMAPKTTAITPCWFAPMADPAPVAWAGVALEAADAPALLALVALELVEDWAGAVVGSATPDGQCQWSLWGSQVAAVTACEWSSSSSS
jgi:hypothetical protein